MRMPFRILLELLLPLSLFSQLTARSSKAPDWVIPLIEHASEVRIENDYEARVMLDWAHYDFSKQGKPRLKVRYAVQIFTWDEQSRAKVTIPYNDRDDRIRRFRAWLITPGGEVKEFDHKDVIDMAGNLNHLYSEERYKELDLSSTVRPGQIFAYEFEIREKTLITQRVFTLQQDIPVDHAQLIVDVPDGWELNFVPLNHPTGKPKQIGQQYRWEAHDIEPYTDEEYGPHPTTFVGQLGFSLYPTNPDNNRKDLFVFRNWTDVAAFGDFMNTPMAQVDQTVQAKAHELTVGLQADWDKIQAIGTFTQGIQYAAIGENLNFGGGIEPFPAPTVLKRQYGDCKDKTALTRALLKAVGIESYSVSARAEEHAVIHEDYPSIGQFNHCIVAIKVGDEVEQEAVVEHPALGRLLFFDPTVKYATIGNLPPSIAGSQVLIDDPRIDRLQGIPKIDISRHFTHRDVEMEVHPDGSISAEIIETNHGNDGIRERSLYYSRTGRGYEDLWRDYIAGHTRDATIQSIEVEDHITKDLFIQKVRFHAPIYGRSMRGRLLVFKPVLIPLHSWTLPNQEERKTPFVKGASHYSETASILLPEGWIVDEMNESDLIESPFGRYETVIRQQGNALKLTRRITWNSLKVPPKAYPQLLDFYQAVIKAENTPVVLVRN